MVAAVRDARHEEAGAIADLLSRAAFGPTVSRLVAFPRTSPHGDVLVAENGDGAAVGAVCCVSFGATGWVGALGGAPQGRRHGLGRALTEAASERLHERGASTVLLFATDMGRPLYERLGFVIEGAATAWRGTAGGHPPPRAARGPPSRPACRSAACARTTAPPSANSTARPRARTARTCSRRCIRWPAWPATARARSSAGPPRRPTAPASPSAPATTRPASH